ncbi:MAG: AAA family ATPase [Solirubrobacteraceae bacterium]
MVTELESHPHARSVLGPVLEAGAHASHAYLFYGPGGSGKREVARALATELLAGGVDGTASARERAMSGAHPDLTWVVPSGAHEILVSDIAEPVIAAASRTPFEAPRRVFVIESVDELGDEAANRMLKTLEEPPSYVHLILITDRLAEVLPTIRSRCQLVRFDAPPMAAVVAALMASAGVDASRAEACARLALGDGMRARELCTAEGGALRQAGEDFARAAVAGQVAGFKPWTAIISAVRGRGELVRAELDAAAAADLELYPRKERKRVETEWADRTKRVRRRVETGALDLSLQIASLWFSDLASLSWAASDLVRARDRLSELNGDLARVTECSGDAARAALECVELVEETRRRFQLNVTEELACEALAYRLERSLSL